MRLKIAMTVAGVLAGLAGILGQQCLAQPALPPVDLSTARYWHMFTGTDGETHVEQLRWPAKFMNELGSKQSIAQFFAATAKSMIVISGKPGWTSPMHNVGNGRELDVVLAGSSTGHFAGGRTQRFTAGDIVLVEDTGSRGRAVEFGPEGYLAVSVQLAPKT